jgi:hypothetical protein
MTSTQSVSTVLQRRRLQAWAIDTGEHAVRALAGATLAAVPVASDNGVSIEAFLEWEPWSIGLGSAAISLLMSIVGRTRGAPNTASLRGTES